MNKLTKDIIFYSFAVASVSGVYLLGKSHGRTEALDEVRAEFMNKQPVAVFYQDFNDDKMADTLQVYKDNSWVLFEVERDIAFSKDSIKTGIVPPSLSSHDRITSENSSLINKINSFVKEKMEEAERK